MLTIIPFAELADDKAIVGGKAANLAIMLRAGLPVPDGFVVTTAGYRTFVRESGVDETMRATFADHDLASYESLQNAAAAIHGAFSAAPLPAAITTPLLTAYQALGGGPVAVRSSATLEDLEDATFAGQHETYLNVVGTEDLVDKVRACWASLYSPQAIRYRAERGYDQVDVALAVVVQRLLDPTTSGVAFTRNPLTGDPTEVHVAATYGLGEALVSGLVTADAYVLRGADLDLAYVEVGDKAVALHPAAAGGIVTEPLLDSLRQGPCLTVETAQQVGRLARRLETHFGTAQDAEWAFVDDDLFVLQSRPMIPVPTSTATWGSPVEGAHWFRNWRLGEWLSDPVSPLFATSLMLHLVAAREEFGSAKLGWGLSPNFRMVQPWYCLINGYFYARDDRDETGEMVNNSDGGPEARTQRALRQTEALRNWQRTHWPRYRHERLPELRRFGIKHATGRALLDYLEELYGDAAEWWYLLAPIGYGFEERTFRRSYEELDPSPDKLPSTALFTGYDSHALAGQRELFAIAQSIEPNAVLREHFLTNEPAEVLAGLEELPEGTEIQRRIRRYLNRHGHQLYTADFRVPTLGEHPTTAIIALQGYLRDQPPAPGLQLAEQRAARRTALAHVRRVARRDPERHRLFMAQLGWRQQCLAVRENAFYDFQRLWPLMRRAVGELGRRLVSAGAINGADDIYYLEQAEVARAIEALDAGGTPDVTALRTTVTRRRDAWATQARLSPPDQVPALEQKSARSGSSAPTARLIQDGRNRRLVGLAASPGRARGPARVIRSADEFGRFRRGDILVAVTTSPAWTVLFPLAAAVVTEVGGGATHSSLVAREYGLPAVVATGIATQVIRDGQIITVDGTNGTVDLGALEA